MKKIISGILIVLLVLQNLSFGVLSTNEYSAYASSTTGSAIEVDTLIDQLDGNIYKIIEARLAYTSLSSAEKKKVKNLSILSKAENTHKPAITYVNAVNAIKFNSTFISKVNSANSLYKKLMEKAENQLLYKEMLEPSTTLLDSYIVLSNFLTDFNKLKFVKNDYEKIKLALATFSDFNDIDQSNLKLVAPQLVTYKNSIESIDAFDIQIEDTITTTTSDIDLEKKLDAVEQAISKYDKLTKTEKPLINTANYAIITTFAKDYADIMKIMDEISKIDATSSKFITQTNAAVKLYSTLISKKGINVEQVNEDLGSSFVLLENYKAASTLIAEAQKQKLATAKDVTAIQDLAARYKDETLDTKVKEILATAPEAEKLEGFLKEIEAVSTFETSIEDALKQTIYKDRVQAVKDVENTYKKLNATVKKLVDSAKYKKITDFIKENAEILKLIDLIQAIDPATAKFVAQTAAADKAYQALAKKKKTNEEVKTLQEDLGENYSTLETSKVAAELIEKVQKQKLANEKDVAAVLDLAPRYNDEKLADKVKEILANAPEAAKLADFLKEIEAVTLFEASIDKALEKEIYKDHVQAVKDVESEYKKLSSTVKKLVNPNKYKKIADFVKENAEILKLIDLIQAIDPATAKFVAQTQAADKAYQALVKKKKTDEEVKTLQEDLGENYLTLETSKVAAELIEKVQKQKLANEKDVTAIEALAACYNDETLDAKVKEILATAPEAAKLAGFLKEIEAVTIFEASIDEALQKAIYKERVQAVKDVENTYKTLNATVKKLVDSAKYKKITDFIKENAEILKLIDLIEKIDPASSKFVAQTQAADKAYQALVKKKKTDEEVKTLQDDLGENYVNLVTFNEASKLVAKADAQKLAKPTDVQQVIDLYNEMIAENLQTVVKDIIKQTVGFKTITQYMEQIKIVQDFEKSIVQTEGTTDVHDQIDQLIKSTNIFSSLGTNEKKLIQFSTTTSFNQLTNKYKEVTNVINLLLDVEVDAPTFIAKLTLVNNAYNKLGDKSLLKDSYKNLLKDYNIEKDGPIIVKPEYNDIVKLKGNKVLAIAKGTTVGDFKNALEDANYDIEISYDSVIPLTDDTVFSNLISISATYKGKVYEYKLEFMDAPKFVEKTKKVDFTKFGITNLLTINSVFKNEFLNLLNTSYEYTFTEFVEDEESDDYNYSSEDYYYSTEDYYNTHYRKILSVKKTSETTPFYNLKSLSPTYGNNISIQLVGYNSTKEIISNKFDISVARNGDINIGEAKEVELIRPIEEKMQVDLLANWIENEEVPLSKIISDNDIISNFKVPSDVGVANIEIEFVEKDKNPGGISWGYWTDEKRLYLNYNYWKKHTSATLQVNLVTTEGEYSAPLFITLNKSEEREVFQSHTYTIDFKEELGKSVSLDNLVIRMGNGSIDTVSFEDKTEYTFNNETVYSTGDYVEAVHVKKIGDTTVEITTLNESVSTNLEFNFNDNLSKAYIATYLVDRYGTISSNNLIQEYAYVKAKEAAKTINLTLKDGTYEQMFLSHSELSNYFEENAELWYTTMVWVNPTDEFGFYENWSSYTERGFYIRLWDRSVKSGSLDLLYLARNDNEVYEPIKLKVNFVVE